MLVRVGGGEPFEQTAYELDLHGGLALVGPLLDVDRQEVDSAHLEVQHLAHLVALLLLLRRAFLRVFHELLRELGRLLVIGALAVLTLLFFAVEEEEVADFVLWDHNVHLWRRECRLGRQEGRRLNVVRR